MDTRWKDGCVQDDSGALGCQFFVGLTVLLSIISYLLSIEKPKVETTVELIHVDSEYPITNEII